MKEKSDLQELVRSDESSCPECKRGQLVEDIDSGERHCKKCGFVDADRLPEAIPHIKFNDDELVFARGDGKGRISQIGLENKDFLGKPISGNMAQTMNRLRVWDKRDMKTHERAMKRAGTVIKEWSSQLGLNDSTKDNALNIFGKAHSEGQVRGRTTDSFMAASILISCNVNKVPRSEKQIIEVSKVKRRALRVAFKMIHRSQNLSNSETTANDFLPIAVSKLNLSAQQKESVVRAANELLAEVYKSRMSDGKSKISLVGAAIFHAVREAKLRIPQNTVAIAAGTTEVSIRNNLKWIKQLSRDAQPSPKQERAVVK